ncbi:glucose-6-phosphate dehydrogenase [Gilbertella persicaria]|uniref:glucose-6-phosphate dehydrogenase n=1 Tax=Gilbertella persicaria TaxID=101096 RepID=UPI00221ED052|nr:glucose-6-phosphate dehydrogenase [Gilbertella persicaria]KAI8091466.1 glucose-6-phosphate dehydrogenase [Gilbertella persicaria]
MLRASRWYAKEAIRFNNQPRRLLSTQVQDKPSGSIMGKLLGLTVVLGSAYSGASYYATMDPAFHQTWTTNVPGAKETVALMEDIQKNQELSKSPEWKKQAEEYASTAKSYGNKLQASTQDAIDYATNAYQTLTGQKPVSTLDMPSQQHVDTLTTTPTTTTTVQWTTDKPAQPAVVAVAIEKPEPIVIKRIQSNHAVVRELSQIVYELASILNESGLSGLGRDIIKEANLKIEQLGQEYSALDGQQQAILDALKQLNAQGDKMEGSLEAFHVQAKQSIEKAHADTAATIVAREAQLKNQFEQTRADMKTSFAQQLAADLKNQQARLEKAREEALVAQAQELQARFVKQVKLLVEQERAGRLAQLDHLSKRFKALETDAIQNAEALDTSRQYHVIHVAVDALEDALEQKQSFVDELQVLSSHTTDPVIHTALSVIPKETAEEGVDTISQLSTRFELISEEIRKVALVPEDGGFGSHIISHIMAWLMFKKQGLVEGDDVESILARTDYYLKRDNLEYAARELNQLTGWPKRLAQDWIQSARRHLEVKQALQVKVQDRLHDGVTFVVFGASGDLAKKKTFPALYALYKNGFLPEKTQIIGYARTKMDKKEFHERIEPNLKGEDKELKGFLDICSYHPGQYDQAEDFKKLNESIEEIEKDYKDEQKNRIFYIALPPSAFVSVSTGLKEHVTSKKGKTSIIIEKPFGKDLESSNQLSEDISKLFSEDQVFRIDHYLGKEMAKNLLNVRFSNMIFNALWSNTRIESVQITLKEPFGSEGRGGYFDEYGIIRDVMQNHLLQLLTMVAMERPISRHAEAIRDEKVKVLRCIKPIKLEDALLGQYVKNGDKPGYTEDETVPDDSLAPTFAALTLWIDNERWANVPFVLKAGKAVDAQKGEIRIQFKKLPGSLFSDATRNELVFRVQPTEAMYMKFNNKSPGFSQESIVTELDLTYEKRYKNMYIPAAYESLILDVMRGDHANFVRDDELEAAWSIFTPLLHEIEQKKIKPESYAYGSRGPDNLDAFIQKYGIERLADQSYEWPTQSLEN